MICENRRICTCYFTGHCDCNRVYILLQVVSIGILGQHLSASTAPIQEAFGKIAGNFGTSLVAAGTIISIGGICVASSFITPRSGVAMAENGIMPAIVGRRNKKNAPYVAILVSATISLLIAWLERSKL